ncbi:helix-turn-helix domain-containing protein [Pendulispora rubella]|uniref:Helix-turn-helix domain-containing protein n=1 Tax=Pendulispora rubella TaxID=2741070 RepID=A0ABZ2L0U8_9BACT
MSAGEDDGLPTSGEAPARTTSDAAESRPTTVVTLDGSTALIVRIEQVPPVQAPDELVAFPFGFEEAAAMRLIRKKTLLAAKIGRKHYARRSDILSLVEKLAKKAESKPKPTNDPLAHYEALIGARRAPKSK